MADLITYHDLCLACSSSLPSTSVKSKSFQTLCCKGYICDQCISSNPRLTRYNPCLACLGGVGVIAAGSGKGKSVSGIVNIDGAVRERDQFVIGDDEDEDEEEDAPPPYQADDNKEGGRQSRGDGTTQKLSNGDVTDSETSGPFRYYIKPTDTLQGIAMRFGVDGRELCRMNNIPPSTLSTTPHILHTRASILVPSSAKASSTALNEPSPDEQRRHEARRAEKRLQLLAKEADWRIARAYVSISDLDTGQEHVKKSVDLESRALDQYLDDDDWERQYGKPRLEGFPYFKEKDEGASSWKIW